MSNTPTSLLALILFVVALLVLVQWIFLRLRRTDTHLYEELGRPDLLTNNNVPNVIAFWKWVYGGSFRYAGGSAISAALWALRIGTVAYVVALIAFAIFHS